MRNAALPIDWGSYPAPRFSFYVCAFSFGRWRNMARAFVYSRVRESSYVFEEIAKLEEEEWKECRDKFRDRSNGDAVSMLLAFAFRLSIQTPLSPNPVPIPPFLFFSPIPRWHPALLFSFLFFFLRGSVNYRMKFNSTLLPSGSLFYFSFFPYAPFLSIGTPRGASYVTCGGRRHIGERNASTRMRYRQKLFSQSRLFCNSRTWVLERFRYGFDIWVLGKVISLTAAYIRNW